MSRRTALILAVAVSIPTLAAMIVFAIVWPVHEEYTWPHTVEEAVARYGEPVFVARSCRLNQHPGTIEFFGVGPPGTFYEERLEVFCDDDEAKKRISAFVNTIEDGASASTRIQLEAPVDLFVASILTWPGSYDIERDMYKQQTSISLTTDDVSD